MTPWRDIALGFLATGLLLVPAWWWARRLGQAVTLLAACALPPLAGILVVEGVRGRPLAAMACAALLCAALFALLTVAAAAAGGSRRSRRWRHSRPGAGVGYFGLVVASPLQRKIASEVLPAAPLQRRGGGDQPVAACLLASASEGADDRRGAARRAGGPRADAAGRVRVRRLRGRAGRSPHARGPLRARPRAPAGAADGVPRERDVPTARRRREPRARRDLDRGRRAAAAASSQAYRNGWTYVTLVAWVVDDGTARARPSWTSSRAGWSLDASPRRSATRRPWRARSATCPCLSPDAARLVVARSAHRPLNPARAPRPVLPPPGGGRSRALSPDEQRELDVLLATAVAAVDARDAAARARVRRAPARGHRGRRVQRRRERGPAEVGPAPAHLRRSSRGCRSWPRARFGAGSPGPESPRVSLVGCACPTRACALPPCVPDGAPRDPGNRGVPPPRSRRTCASAASRPSGSPSTTTRAWRRSPATRPRSRPRSWSGTRRATARAWAACSWCWRTSRTTPTASRPRCPTRSSTCARSRRAAPTTSATTTTGCACVLTHELAHVVHLDQARGIVGFGRKVLGRAPYLFPNVTTPGLDDRGARHVRGDGGHGVRPRPQPRRADDPPHGGAPGRLPARGRGRAGPRPLAVGERPVPVRRGLPARPLASATARRRCRRSRACTRAAPSPTSTSSPRRR